MKKTLQSIVVFLFFFAYSSQAQLDLSPINNLKYSPTYSLKANGTNKLVYESTESFQTKGGSTEYGNEVKKMSFANFDLQGTTTIEITISKAFKTFDFRPLNANISAIREGNKITFTLQNPQKIVLRIDNSWDNTLCIFANPYHIVPKKTDVTYFFDNTKVHDYYKGKPILNPANPNEDIQQKTEVEAIVLKDGESVYLAEGAVVRARFEVPKDAKVKIFGRGVLAYGLGHVEDFGVISARSHTGKVELEGLTICDAPGWIIRIFGGKGHLVDNIKQVGNWHFNTDGVQMGVDGPEMSYVQNCFLQNNDDNFSLPSNLNALKIHNNILWNIFNGGVFNFGWGKPKISNVEISDNIILRSGDCCNASSSNGIPELERRKAPFTMISYGNEQIDGLTIKNIIIEEIIKQGQWIHFISNTKGNGFVKNVRFENIQILNQNKVWGLLKGSKPDGISNISFKNLQINGKFIENLNDAGLVLNNAQESTIIFSRDISSSKSISDTLQHLKDYNKK
ncbi:MAG: hypothetical protein KA313_04915 [Pseudarcicella sp.]|nr:hypothetical protein [Pseudarcicella sp.]MBP6410420.1 hypothetical protein [Pseudarcicella sp.]